MAEGVEDSLFLQARGIVGVEFEEWIGKLLAVLQSSDRGPTCLTLLRQLYVLTAATKYRRNLSLEIYKLLLSIVLEPEQGSLKVRLIAATILQELSPSKHIDVPDFNPPVERRNIPFVLPVMLAQSNTRDKLIQFAPKIIEFMTGPGQDSELALAVLSALHGLCSHPRALELVEAEQLHSIGLQLATWLKQASKNSQPAPTTGISLFGGGGKKQLIPVKEIDGGPSQGIFTVLNLGGYYSTDQLLNVAAFSFLRRWLRTAVVNKDGVPPSPSTSLSATPTPEVESRSISRTSTPSLTSSLPGGFTSPLVSSGGSPLISPGAGRRGKPGLKEAAVQYCLRVIEQCERKPLKSEDMLLIDACLYECISTLNLLCSASSSLIHTVFPKMRLLYSRVTQDPISNSRLLLVLLQFFVNHGESEMYDLDGLIDLFFGKVLSIKFNDPALAYDVIAYLIDNTEKLHTSTSIFTKFFPNILKILAWFPVTFTAEFLQLLPTFISENTALEVLHSILDLPCLAATLQAQYILSTHPNSTIDTLFPQYSKCLAAFQDGTYKFMFGHFLRSENGKGDTIDRLGSLHHLLLDFVEHERVKAVARVAPLMMKIFFKTVLYGGNSKVTIQLASILLERIVLLYNLEPFVSEAHKVLAKQLLLIYELHPHLVVDQQRDLLDYLGNLRTLTTGGEHCYIHLIWIVGEYSHVGYDSRCSSSLLNQFFGTLESVAYEISINFNKEVNFSTRLLMVLMSTVAKLASRCQDLIPRALLCLNKIVLLSSDTGNDQDTHRILLNRANELVNVLKIPSLASAVLSPPPHHYGTKEMKRQTDMTRLLQSTSNHLNIK